MKSSSGLSSRMSGYQYVAKKSPWKWTTGKIAAFSAFGVIMVTLIYIESNSNQNANQTTPVITESTNSTDVSSEFDKQYQEFLKQGEKIIKSGTLDSVEQSTTDHATNTTLAPSVKSSKPQNVVAKNPVTTRKPVAQVEKNVESNLQPIQLSPASNNNNAIPSQGQPGGLEELDPEEEASLAASNSNQTTANSSEKVIIEEFYTEDKITGTITTLTGRTPIKGATVTVKGTNISTISDSNGKYTITVPGDPLYRTLRFSYLGNSIERDASPGAEILDIRF